MKHYGLSYEVDTALYKDIPFLFYLCAENTLTGNRNARFRNAHAVDL